jgi:hypothetical protein
MLDPWIGGGFVDVEVEVEVDLEVEVEGLVAFMLFVVSAGAGLSGVTATAEAAAAESACSLLLEVDRVFFAFFFRSTAGLLIVASCALLINTGSTPNNESHKEVSKSTA